MAQRQLPTVKAVHDLLNDLFGRDVEIAARAVLTPELPPNASVGVYRDDAKNTVAVVTADLALAAYMAAGLALTSKDDAEELVAKGVLPDGFAETTHEILNIMGSLFNAPALPHVRLYAMHRPGEPVPPLAASFATATGQRLDLTVTIPGYGSGELALVL